MAWELLQQAVSVLGSGHCSHSGAISTKVAASYLGLVPESLGLPKK